MGIFTFSRLIAMAVGVGFFCAHTGTLIHFVELLYHSTMKMPNGHSEEREAPAKHY